MNREALPVAVIGAGPVGFAAAAQLAQRQLPFVVLEAGAAAGASVRQWGHVQLFSPWRYVIDAAAQKLLSAHGWTAPDPEAYPTGAALVREYLEPLASLPELAPQLRFGTRVVAITRQGFDKLKTAGRATAPFVLHLANADGTEAIVLAQAVIDASGTYTAPNPLGAAGRPAPGEAAATEQISYGIPDLLGCARARYAGKRVLVVGSGHSAFHGLLALTKLAAEAPGTTITWAIRRGDIGQLYGGGADDALPARGALGRRVHDLVQRGGVQLVTGFHSAAIERTTAGMVVRSDTHALPPVDEVIVATGFRPDLAITSELRLALDPIVESPVALAELIDPNIHSCGTVPPHGVDQLSHPEPGFYTVGMKSYGRAPTFLLLTGYEQVRSVTAALAGDWSAARDMQLVLPETGVCSGSDGDGCCTVPSAPSSAAIELLPLTAACCTPAAQTGCCETAVDACGCAAESASQ